MPFGAGGSGASLAALAENSEDVEAAIEDVAEAVQDGNQFLDAIKTLGDSHQVKLESIDTQQGEIITIGNSQQVKLEDVKSSLKNTNTGVSVAQALAKDVGDGDPHDTGNTTVFQATDMIAGALGSDEGRTQANLQEYTIDAIEAIGPDLVIDLTNVTLSVDGNVTVDTTAGPVTVSNQNSAVGVTNTPGIWQAHKPGGYDENVTPWLVTGGTNEFRMRIDTNADWGVTQTNFEGTVTNMTEFTDYLGTNVMADFTNSITNLTVELIGTNDEFGLSFELPDIGKMSSWVLDIQIDQATEFFERLTGQESGTLPDTAGFTMSWAGVAVNGIRYFVLAVVGVLWLWLFIPKVWKLAIQ